MEIIRDVAVIGDPDDVRTGLMVKLDRVDGDGFMVIDNKHHFKKTFGDTGIVRHLIQLRNSAVTNAMRKNHRGGTGDWRTRPGCKIAQAASSIDS